MPEARFSARLQRLAADPASSAWAIQGRALALAASGRDVLFLSIGDPDFATPPSVIDAAVQALREGRTHYPAIAGESRLRRAIAAYHTAHSGRACSAEQVHVFPGAQNTLFNLMQALVGEGDEVLVADPYYATYPGVVAAAGATLRTIDTSGSGWRLDPTAVTAAMGPATRVLLLNSPSNPAGSQLDRNELAALVALCRERDLWLVADEVYADLAYTGPANSAWEFSDYDRVVVVSSASKRLAMSGFRLGWCIGPNDLIGALKALATAGLFGSPPFTQDAVAAALESEPPEVARMRAAYARRAAVVVNALAAVSGLTVDPPSAGMFVLLGVADLGVDGALFASRLLEEEGIAVMPGNAFGAAARNHVRISLVQPEARLGEACDRIAALAHRLREP